VYSFAWIASILCLFIQRQYYLSELLFDATKTYKLDKTHICKRFDDCTIQTFAQKINLQLRHIFFLAQLILILYQRDLCNNTPTYWNMESKLKQGRHH